MARAESYGGAFGKRAANFEELNCIRLVVVDIAMRRILQGEVGDDGNQVDGQRGEENATPCRQSHSHSLGTPKRHASSALAQEADHRTERQGAQG